MMAGMTLRCLSSGAVAGVVAVVAELVAGLRSELSPGSGEGEGIGKVSLHDSWMETLLGSSFHSEAGEISRYRNDPSTSLDDQLTGGGCCRRTSWGSVL